MKKNKGLLKWIAGCVLIAATFGIGVLGARMIDSRIHPDENAEETEEPEIIMDDYVIVDEFPVLSDESTDVSNETGMSSIMNDSTEKTEDQTAEPDVIAEEQLDNISPVPPEDQSSPEQSQPETPEPEIQQPEGNDPVPTDTPLGENETPILPIG